MAQVYLLLGGNLGNRGEMLAEAVSCVHERIGHVISRSSVYETAPWGYAAQPMFLNQVIRVETKLKPEQLLETIEAIESKLGRTREGEPQQARLIDIDILFYDDLVYRSDRLIIPHARLHLRSFTLVPLLEIAPDYVHPVLNLTVSELYRTCRDDLEVKKYLPSFSET